MIGIADEAIFADLQHLVAVADAYEGAGAQHQMLADAPSPSVASAFASASIPPLPLRDYAARLAHWNGNGAQPVAMGFGLLKRYHEMTGTPPTELTAHRLLLAATVVATKFHFDTFHNNTFLAKVGGISASELARLELALLVSLDYRVWLRDGDFTLSTASYFDSLGGQWDAMDTTVSATAIPGVVPSNPQLRFA